jgi:uncharacterized protein (DUF169 family)
LPLAFYYTEAESHAELARGSAANRCLIANLVRVRSGTPLAFGADSVGCAGGCRYLGFSATLRPNFDYFLSYGIPGKMEGERYKKNPEIVARVMAQMPKFEAPAKYAVFKRWDQLDATDQPDVVIFFAKPDVLAGLFTLASYDEAQDSGVRAPFGAGCATIVQYPYLEKDSPRPRCILGMFDPSARPYVPADTVTFAVPGPKFERMVANIEESFLITETWSKIRQRIGTPENSR